MSSPSILSRLRTFRLYWKTLRLPWRKKFLCGVDLEGNTYWEFRVRMHASRPRRIVEWADKSKGLDELRMSPMWHQWLRCTRMDPPTIEEQVADVKRLEQLKVNAALADARWEAKGRIVSGQGAGGEVRLPIAEGTLKDGGKLAKNH